MSSFDKVTAMHSSLLVLSQDQHLKNAMRDFCVEKSVMLSFEADVVRALLMILENDFEWLLADAALPSGSVLPMLEILKKCTPELSVMVALDENTEHLALAYCEAGIKYRVKKPLSELELEHIGQLMQNGKWQKERKVRTLV